MQGAPDDEQGITEVYTLHSYFGTSCNNTYYWEPDKAGATYFNYLTYNWDGTNNFVDCVCESGIGCGFGVQRGECYKASSSKCPNKGSDYIWNYWSTSANGGTTDREKTTYYYYKATACNDTYGWEADNGAFFSPAYTWFDWRSSSYSHCGSPTVCYKASTSRCPNYKTFNVWNYDHRTAIGGADNNSTVNLHYYRATSCNSTYAWVSPESQTTNASYFNFKNTSHENTGGYCYGALDSGGNANAGSACYKATSSKCPTQANTYVFNQEHRTTTGGLTDTQVTTYHHYYGTSCNESNYWYQSWLGGTATARYGIMNTYFNLMIYNWDGTAGCVVKTGVTPRDGFLDCYKASSSKCPNNGNTNVWNIYSVNTGGGTTDSAKTTYYAYSATACNATNAWHTDKNLEAYFPVMSRTYSTATGYCSDPSIRTCYKYTSSICPTQANTNVFIQTHTTAAGGTAETGSTTLHHYYGTGCNWDYYWFVQGSHTNTQNLVSTYFNVMSYEWDGTPTGLGSNTCRSWNPTAGFAGTCYKATSSKCPNKGSDYVWNYWTTSQNGGTNQTQKTTYYYYYATSCNSNYYWHADTGVGGLFNYTSRNYPTTTGFCSNAGFGPCYKYTSSKCPTNGNTNVWYIKTASTTGGTTEAEKTTYYHYSATACNTTNAWHTDTAASSYFNYMNRAYPTTTGYCSDSGIRTCYKYTSSKCPNRDSTNVWQYWSTSAVGGTAETGTTTYNYYNATACNGGNYWYSNIPISTEYFNYMSKTHSTAAGYCRNDGVKTCYKASSANCANRDSTYVWNYWSTSINGGPNEAGGSTLTYYRATACNSAYYWATNTPNTTYFNYMSKTHSTAAGYCRNSEVTTCYKASSSKCPYKGNANIWDYASATAQGGTSDSAQTTLYSYSATSCNINNYWWNNNTSIAAFPGSTSYFNYMSRSYPTSAGYCGTAPTCYKYTSSKCPTNGNTNVFYVFTTGIGGGTGETDKNTLVYYKGTSCHTVNAWHTDTNSGSYFNYMSRTYGGSCTDVNTCYKYTSSKCPTNGNTNVWYITQRSVTGGADETSTTTYYHYTATSCNTGNYWHTDTGVGTLFNYMSRSYSGSCTNINTCYKYTSSKCPTNGNMNVWYIRTASTTGGATETEKTTYYNYSATSCNTGNAWHTDTNLSAKFYYMGRTYSTAAGYCSDASIRSCYKYTASKCPNIGNTNIWYIATTTATGGTAETGTTTYYHYTATACNSGNAWSTSTSLSGYFNYMTQTYSGSCTNTNTCYKYSSSKCPTRADTNVWYVTTTTTTGGTALQTTTTLYHYSSTSCNTGNAWHSDTGASSYFYYMGRSHGGSCGGPAGCYKYTASRCPSANGTIWTYWTTAQAGGTADTGSTTLTYYSANGCNSGQAWYTAAPNTTWFGYRSSSHPYCGSRVCYKTNSSKCPNKGSTYVWNFFSTSMSGGPNDSGTTTYYAYSATSANSSYYWYTNTPASSYFNYMSTSYTQCGLTSAYKATSSKCPNANGTIWSYWSTSTNGGTTDSAQTSYTYYSANGCNSGYGWYTSQVASSYFTYRSSSHPYCGGQVCYKASTSRCPNTNTTIFTYWSTSAVGGADGNTSANLTYYSANGCNSGNSWYTSQVSSSYFYYRASAHPYCGSRTCYKASASRCPTNGNTNVWYVKTTTTDGGTGDSGSTTLYHYSATSCNSGNAWHSDTSYSSYFNMMSRTYGGSCRSVATCYKYTSSKCPNTNTTIFTYSDTTAAGGTAETGSTTLHYYTANGCNNSNYWYTSINTSVFTYNSSSHPYCGSRTCYKPTGCASGWSSTQPSGAFVYQTQSLGNITCYKATGCASGYTVSQPNSSIFTYNTYTHPTYNNCYDTTGCKSGYTNSKQSGFNYNQWNTGDSYYCYRAYGCASGWLTYQTNTEAFSYESQYDSNVGYCYNAISCNYGYTTSPNTTYFRYYTYTSDGYTCYKPYSCASGKSASCSSYGTCGSGYEVGVGTCYQCATAPQTHQSASNWYPYGTCPSGTVKKDPDTCGYDNSCDGCGNRTVDGMFCVTCDYVNTNGYRRVHYSQRSDCCSSSEDPDRCGYDNDCDANGNRTWDGAICN